MADNLSQHPPAVKVGGRRLSTTNRARPHMNTYVGNLTTRAYDLNTQHIASEQAQQEHRSAANEEAAPADYPRPNPSDQNNEVPHRKQREEEQPRKERQDKKTMDAAQRKMESTMPTRDANGGKGYVSGARINQPAGKTLGV